MTRLFCFLCVRVSVCVCELGRGLLLSFPQFFSCIWNPENPQPKTRNRKFGNKTLINITKQNTKHTLFRHYPEEKKKLGNEERSTSITHSHTQSVAHSHTEKRKESCHHNLFTNTSQVPFTTSICSQLYPRLSMPIAPPPLWWPWHLRPLVTATRSVETHIPAASTTRRWLTATVQREETVTGLTTEVVKATAPSVGATRKDIEAAVHRVQ